MSWRRSGKGGSGTGGATSSRTESVASSGSPPAEPPEPREPTPARGEDAPEVVLDELRQAFTGHQPDIADIADIDLDDLPPAEFDDLTGEPPLVAPAPRATIRIGDELSPGIIAPNVAIGTTGPADRTTGGARDQRRSEPPVVALDTTAPLDDTELWEVQPPGRRETPGPLDPLDPLGVPSADDPWAVASPERPDRSEFPGAGSFAGTGSPARPTIVIGGDDDLPDAVYLDDELGRGPESGGAAERGESGDPAALGDSGERGTIVIGDELEASGAFDAVAIPSRSMDPRVRARRIAVKRAQGRKRLLWVAGVGGVVLVVVAVLAVFSSSLFAVERIDVQGAPYTQARYADRLQEVIDQLEGEPVLLVDTRAAEEALEALPWIERAFVRTDFPNRVLIDVRERQPLATFQGSDGRYRVIDRDGFVLDVLDGRPASYMLVGGTGPDIEAGSSAGTPFAAAAQLVGALPAEIRDITVSATLDPSTIDLGLIIQRIPPVDPDAPADPADPAAGGDGAATHEPELVTVRIGSFNGLDGKLARLLQVVRDGLDDASPIDVSTDDVIG